jgi:lipid II:glycine glycyltransferase (peptidoglycan interpeptide bridge formation enzyme)
VNRAVHKAKKFGIQVRDADSEEDLAKWYQFYLLTMRHNAVPPRSYRFFKSLWSSLKAEGHMQLLVAEKTERGGDRKMIAGSVLLQFGQTVFYAFTGCEPGNWRLHPHDILQIEAIRGACRAGYRWYDFGEVPEEHEALMQFKTKWGGAPKPFYRYYYPAPLKQLWDRPGGLGKSVRRLWRCLPAPVTAVVGDWLYSRM